MATIKDVMDDVADQCAVAPPASWITANTLTYRQLKTSLRQTVEELLDRIDWPDPITKNVTITGTGAETYALPSDFLRLTRDDGATYETSTTRRRGIPVPTNSNWTFLQDWGSASGDRYFRLAGDETSGFTVSFFRSLAASDEVIVSYVSRNWMRSSGGTEGETWSDAGDTLLLPPELIEMGCVWRSRRRRGLPYQDRLNEYEARLNRKANDRRVVRSINFGDQEPRNPFDIVPDFLPPA